jgi:thioredoxin-related protein
MMYFWAVWCQYCAKFQTDTLGNPQVKQILENDYVLVAMDLDVDRDVSNTYGVSYPPYLIFMDPKGNVLERVPGAVGPDYLLPIVTQIRDKVRSK